MIKFGTAGIRRVNLSEEEVRRVVHAICDTLPINSFVLVGRDTRESGSRLAETAIKVLYARGICPIYIKEPIAISLFSYEIKSRKQCKAGLYFSASHNPSEYNGIKIFNSKGIQIDKKLCKAIEGIANSDISYEEYEEDGAYGYTGISASDIENRYIETLGVHDNKVPLYYNCGYGTGRTVIPKAIKNIELIEETNREVLDKSCNNLLLNPENKEATSFDDKKIVVATDPDCDRIAVCEYGKYINGHDMTALLLDYFINLYPEIKNSNTKLYKSKVTSLLAEYIAKENNIDVVNTNVGFRYIAKHVDDDSFLLGAEESCGYLLTSLVSEKCAISSLIIISQMIDYWNDKGLTLSERLSQIREEYIDIAECTTTENAALNELIKKLSNQYVFVSQLNGIIKMINIETKNFIYIRQSGTENNKCKVYFKNFNRR